VSVILLQRNAEGFWHIRCEQKKQTRTRKRRIM